MKGYFALFDLDFKRKRLPRVFLLFHHFFVLDIMGVLFHGNSSIIHWFCACLLTQLFTLSLRLCIICITILKLQIVHF